MQRLTTGLLLITALLSGCSRHSGPQIVDDPRVIILMYHRITAGEASNIYERSAAEFEKDLEYLHENNIRVIDLSELKEIVDGETDLLSHAAVITFDDGDRSWYTLAAPLLKKYRMKGTFFLWASRMGMDSFLTWDEVTLMSNFAYEGGVRPFSFGSHTMSHQYLMTMKDALGGGATFDAYLDEELGGSKILIDKHIYDSVDALALPFGNGAGDTDIIAAAQRNGYSFIRTSERNVTGTAATDLYRLPSLPMLDDTAQEQIGTYLGIE